MQSTSGWVDANTGAALDPEWIENLINRRLGDTVALGGKLKVLDWAMRPVDMGLVGGNPDDPSDIAPFVVPESAQVSLDASQPVQRKLSFTMKDPQFMPGKVPLAFDPYSHFLRPYTVMECQGKRVEFPLATYWMGAPQDAIYSDWRSLTFSGLDLSSLISLCDLISDWTVVANYVSSNKYLGSTVAGYIGALLDLLMSDSVPKSLLGAGQTPQGNDDAGPGIPASMLDFDMSGNQAVGIPLIWPPGTNRLGKACADITDAINYWPLHLSNKDALLLRRIPDWASTQLPMSWDYSVHGDSTVGPEITGSFDNGTRLANLVKVDGGQSTGAGGSALSSLQYNNNPSSRISYANLRNLSGRPRAIPLYENNSNLANSAMAQLRAKILLNMGDSVQESRVMTTLHNPLTEAFETYVFDVVLKDGTEIIVSDSGHMYLEMGWQMNFMDPAGRQRHDLVRLFAL